MFIFFALKINFEEDISKALPKNREVDVYNNFFNKIKVSEKIIFYLSSPDVNTEVLIETADAVTAKLEHELYPEYVKEINYKFSQDTYLELYDFVIQNLPLFLTKRDYQAIDTLIQKQNTDRTMQSNYNMLMSPAGFAMKKFITADPLSLAQFAVRKFMQLNVSDAYISENDRIFTKDRKSLVFFIVPANQSGETSKNAVMLEKLDKIITETNLALKNKVNINYFGSVPVAVGNAKQLKKDIMLTVSLGMLGIFLFVFWYYKKIWLAFISFTPAIFGGSMALATIYFIKGSMSAIALGAGSILLGIIVDYVFYVYNNYNLNKDGEKVVGEMSFTLLICSLTSITAFFSLLFVKSPILQDLGLFAGLSIGGAALFSIIALPQFFDRLIKEGKNKEIPSIIASFISFPLHKSKIALSVLVLLTVTALFFASRAGFETDMSQMNYMSPEMKKTEKMISADSEALLKSVYLISQGNSIDDALEKMNSISPLVKQLSSKGLVTQFSSISEIIPPKSVQKSKIEDWKRFWTAEKKELLKKNLQSSAGKFSFNENAFSAFYDKLDADYSIVSIDSTLGNHPIFREFTNKARDKIFLSSILKVTQEKRNDLLASLRTNKDVAVFDRQEFTNSIVEGIKLDFSLLVNLALILVSLVILLSFGRIEIGLPVAVPMFLSWLLVLGFMAVAGIKFNIFNIIISTFIFGLGTDYSILMMRGLQNEYKSGIKGLNSYKSSIIVSSVTTIIGVGVLIFAKHPSLNSIALISIIGMLAVALLAFIIQPLSFRIITHSFNKKRSYPLTLINLFFTAMTLSMFVVGCIIGYIAGHLVFTLFPFTKRNRKIKYVYHWLMAFLCGIDVRANFHIKKRIIKSPEEDFSKPAVIICNHQSHVDIPLFIMMNPKLILLTNDWVWNSKFFGSVIRFADYYPIAWGYENSITVLEDRVKEGYSIVVFPEGTRSKDGKINRFHKGAFFIAEKLGLDILPVLMHGSGNAISKDELIVKKSTISIKFLDRIPFGDTSIGETYQDRTKNIAAFYKEKYEEFRLECETPDFFRDKVIKNYIYKGPVLEWYVRSKLSAENNYSLFHELLPKKGKIIDIGCGYGYVDYMLSFLSPDREISAFDFDEDKIIIAQHCFNKPDKLTFRKLDATNFEYEKADAFLLSDVLHYFSYQKQMEVLEKCIESLNDGGLILIRDANSNLQKRNSITKLSEIWSTLSGFNKAKYSEMNFETEKSISAAAERNNISVEIIDDSRFTSNVIYLLRKNLHDG